MQVHTWGTSYGADSSLWPYLKGSYTGHAALTLTIPYNDTSKKLVSDYCTVDSRIPYVAKTIKFANGITEKVFIIFFALLGDRLADNIAFDKMLLLRRFDFQWSDKFKKYFSIQQTPIRSLLWTQVRSMGPITIEHCDNSGPATPEKIEEIQLVAKMCRLRDRLNSLNLLNGKIIAANVMNDSIKARKFLSDNKLLISNVFIENSELPFNHIDIPEEQIKIISKMVKDKATSLNSDINDTVVLGSKNFLRNRTKLYPLRVLKEKLKFFILNRDINESQKFLASCKLRVSEYICKPTHLNHELIKDDVSEQIIIDLINAVDNALERMQAIADNSADKSRDIIQVMMELVNNANSKIQPISKDIDDLYERKSHEQKLESSTSEWTKRMIFKLEDQRRALVFLKEQFNIIIISNDPQELSKFFLENKEIINSIIPDGCSYLIANKNSQESMEFLLKNVKGYIKDLKECVENVKLDLNPIVVKDRFLTVGAMEGGLVSLPISNVIAADVGQPNGLDVEAMLQQMHSLATNNIPYSLSIKNCCTSVAEILEAGVQQQSLKRIVAERTIIGTNTPQMVNNAALKIQQEIIAPEPTDIWSKLKEFNPAAPIENLIRLLLVFMLNKKFSVRHIAATFIIVLLLVPFLIIKAFAWPFNMLGSFLSKKAQVNIGGDELPAIPLNELQDRQTKDQELKNLLDQNIVTITDIKPMAAILSFAEALKNPTSIPVFDNNNIDKINKYITENNYISNKLINDIKKLDLLFLNNLDYNNLHDLVDELQLSSAQRVTANVRLLHDNITNRKKDGMTTQYASSLCNVRANGRQAIELKTEKSKEPLNPKI